MTQYYNPNRGPDWNYGGKNWKLLNKNLVYDTKYMKFRIGKNIKNIKQVEIVPIFNGLKYKIIIITEKIIKSKKVPKKNDHILTEKYMSIDFGQVCLATIYVSDNLTALPPKGGRFYL